MKFKHLGFVFSFLLLFACRNPKNKNSVSPSSNGLVQQEQVDSTSVPSQLEGIWVLNKFNKETIKNKTSVKNPTLHILPSKGKVLGNDGCNKYSGTIKLVGKNKIEIKVLETTKIICDSSHVDERYLEAISQKRFSYEVTAKKAIFYNDNTTLVFGKVPESNTLLDKKQGQ